MLLALWVLWFPTNYEWTNVLWLICPRKPCWGQGNVVGWLSVTWIHWFSLITDWMDLSVKGSFRAIALWHFDSFLYACQYHGPFPPEGCFSFCGFLQQNACKHSCWISSAQERLVLFGHAISICEVYCVATNFGHTCLRWERWLLLKINL